MRLVNWNINSFVRRRHLLDNLINYYNPDIICLQETRTQDPIYIDNYICYNYYAKGKRGTSILFKNSLIKISIPRVIKHKGVVRPSTTRFIHIVWNNIHIINVYTPTGGPNSDEKTKLNSVYGPGKTDHTNYMYSISYKYKLLFLSKTLACMKYYHSINQRVICVGDFNMMNLRDMLIGIKSEVNTRRYVQGIYKLNHKSIKIYENYLYNKDLNQMYMNITKDFVDRGSLCKYQPTYKGYADGVKLRIDYIFTNFYETGMTYTILENFEQVEGRSDHFPIMLEY